MQAKTEIRLACASDHAAVLRIAEQMHESSRYATFAPFSVAKMDATIASLLASDDGFIGIATVDGTVVGALLGVICEYSFSTACYAADIGLFVLPSARGGIGRRLTELFSSWAADRGVVTVCQGVTADIANDAAGRMLTSIGFVPVGQLYEREVTSNV